MRSFGGKVKVQWSTVQFTVLYYDNSTCVKLVSDFKVGTCMWRNVHIARTELTSAQVSYLTGWFIFQMRALLLAFLGMRRVLNSDQPHATYIKYSSEVVHMYGNGSVSNFQLPWYRKFACD